MDSLFIRLWPAAKHLVEYCEMLRKKNLLVAVDPRAKPAAADKPMFEANSDDNNDDVPEGARELGITSSMMKKRFAFAPSTKLRKQVEDEDSTDEDNNDPTDAEDEEPERGRKRKRDSGAKDRARDKPPTRIEDRPVKPTCPKCGHEFYGLNNVLRHMVKIHNVAKSDPDYSAGACSKSVVRACEYCHKIWTNLFSHVKVCKAKKRIEAAKKRRDEEAEEAAAARAAATTSGTQAYP